LTNDQTFKHSRQVEPKRKALLFLMSKKNLNIPIGAFGALKFFKIEIKMRKLWPPKVEGVKNSKK